MEIAESGRELIRCNDERIYVSVRLRPLNHREILSNDVSDWECINDDTVVYKNVGLLASDRSLYPTVYTFDKVFRTDCSTREVYEQGAKDVALSVIRGINSTVFAYGQTSSGKTYTMTGITEYAMTDIYDYIHKHPERDFILKFSAMEIYNESVRDLLSSDSTSLRLLDDPERGTTVEKLTEEVLRDKNHVNELLSICEALRQIGETSLNEMSSRSHQIIRLTIESSSREFLGRGNASTLAASVNFVDLAGSERASQSLSAGTRLTEGCHINRSLLTLGTVIRKLRKERTGNIPYRDSKLTRILQTSLGGNARTAIICTMSPARSYVEQSRNTLLFASCAKEVTTNAKVNVLMSDKALVKHLQKELARLGNELRSNQSNVVPVNYSAIIREKDAQIEKLEKEIKDLILQRDIAESKVKEFIKILGDDASSITQVGLGQYPHLRVQKSSDAETQEPETDDASDGYSSSSENHFVKIPYADQNFEQTSASPRISVSSSNSNESDSHDDWGEIDKRSNGTSEDHCKEVRCIETLELSNKEAIESDHSSFEENDASPAVKLQVNGSPHSVKDQELMPSPLKDDIVPSKEGQELILASEIEGKELISPMFQKEKDFATAKYSFGARSLNLARSKSCKASIFSESSSPWFKMMEYCDNTPCIGSEKGSESCERKVYTFGSSVERLSRKDCKSPSETALDIEIEKFSNAENGISSTSGMREISELQTEQEVATKSANEISPKVNESPKRNVKDVGLYPIDGLTSWPVEFKRLQKEIIELWHACNVSLVHRTYFFLLFQGDPSDAIYLEVEIRRMKFLKDKFSRGDTTVVNGRRLTLSSSAKALRNERRMLSEQMSKKFTEQEREILFIEWSIGLNSKLRRLQLAHRMWTKTNDMKHITDSAVLVAKLVGLIEPGQAPNKEMFGLNFTPKCSTGICSFKRSLVSIL